MGVQGITTYGDWRRLVSIESLDSGRGFSAPRAAVRLLC